MFFKPALFSSLRTYNREKLISDTISGIIVGIVAIPLAIAFAIASGVSPEKGLYTAIIAGFVIAVMGGSNVQVSGPTGAFIVIISGVVGKFGIEGLVISTLLAGIMLIIMGSIRLGSVIQFIPYPVIVGFTSGIAVIIFSSQVNDIAGLGLTNIPPHFLSKWGTYITGFAGIRNFWPLIISIGSVGVILLWNRFFKKIPGALIALLAATAAVTYFKLPVETIGTRFGEIKASFPTPVIPSLGYDTIKELLFPAFTIALLGGIESLLSAVVADGMTGKKHDSNTELIAQGCGNVVSGIFGCIPATGAIARTATNIKNGGKTPVSSIIHTVVILLVVLFLGKLAALIPLAALSGILIIVSYNMSEWRSFKAILRMPKSDIAILLTTFLLTVLVDLTIAIPMGLIIALLLFIKRMNAVSTISVIKDEFVEAKEINDPLSINTLEIPKGVEIYEINGPFFFGVAEKFKETMLQLEKPPIVRILRMRHVPAIDSSGIKLIEDIFNNSKKHGTHLILSGVNEQPMAALKRIGLTDKIGTLNLCDNIHSALNRAKEILGLKEKSIIEKINQGGIIRDIKGNNPIEVISDFVDKMVLPQNINSASLKRALIEREEMMSTGIGSGIAIPHPRNPLTHKTISDEFICIGYLAGDVDFNSPDGESVHTVIIAVSSSSRNHLETLSKIAKFCADGEFISLLKNRSDLGTLISYMEKK